VGAGIARRPGLAEAVAVWILFGVVAVEVWATYARLPTDELYNVSARGVAAGAGRALVFLNYPTALVAMAILGFVAARLGGRLALLAVPAAVLCAIVAWPGVVDQADLDAKPVNALPALGVAAAVALTALAVARGGLASRPFGGGWDVARAGGAALLLLGALPWLAAELGFHLEGVPGAGSVFLTGEPRPEPGHPGLTAVHLGHHHGMDGTLLALAALALSRAVRDVGARPLRLALGLYVALMLAYGLANAVQDFWLEQLVKRGTTSLELPTMIVPSASWAWAALVAASVLVFAAARLVPPEGWRDGPASEGAPTGG
jgi:hypothetical protein